MSAVLKLHERSIALLSWEGKNLAVESLHQVLFILSSCAIWRERLNFLPLWKKKSAVLKGTLNKRGGRSHSGLNLCMIFGTKDVEEDLVEKLLLQSEMAAAVVGP